MKLFTGSANPEITQELAGLLATKISASEVVRFGNSEVRVRIIEDVKNQVSIIVQPTSNPSDTNIMELCFFSDALRRQEASKIIGVIPYFGYAKQNIAHRLGECVSANVIIRLLESIGFSKIYTFDLHDEATAGAFSIPFRNLSVFPLLAHHLATFFKKKNIPLEKIVCVSPDQGAVEKVRNFGTAFYGHDHFSEAVIEKERDQNIMHKARPLGLYGDVKDKIAVIVDDMVVSGSTLIPAVDLCLEKGSTEVYTCIVHHDFIEGAAELIQKSKVKRFFTTNTIKLKEAERFEKLEEISIAPILAKELQYLV